MKKLYVLLIVPSVLVLMALSLQAGLVCGHPLVFVVYPLLCSVALVASLTGIAIGFRSGRRGRFFAILCVIVLGAYLLIPSIWRVHRSMAFALKRANYVNAVNHVRQQDMPAAYEALADKGPVFGLLMPCTEQIAVEKGDRGLFVLFYIPSAYGEFAGYMYVEDGQPPSSEQYQGMRNWGPPAPWVGTQRVDANWFWVGYAH